MYKDLNDYELIYMIRESNIEEEILLKKYEPLIKTICNKYCGYFNNALIDYSDLYNVGLYALSLAIHKYDDKSSLFYTYAYITITSKILNYIKVNSGKNKDINNNLPNYEEMELYGLLDYNSYINFTELEFNSNNINNILKEYLYNLDYKYMPVFEMFINGYSNKDISKLLGIHSNTVCLYIKKFKKELIMLLK